MLPHEARALYASLLKIRIVEEVIAKHYPMGNMKCPVHLCIGQEAVPVAICAGLDHHDFVTSNHRSHGHYLAKGGDPLALLRELHGLPSGCTRGWGGSQHPYAPDVGFMATSAIVSGGIPVATGIAQACKWQKKNALSVVFMGDGATEEGNFYESLNYAALQSLPVLFVCENNGYAVHSPARKRRADGVRLVDIARSLGVESYEADGNNLVELHTLAQQIISSMRNTPHPCFIEARTYRWKGHVTPDEDFGPGYRPQEEIEHWKTHCPVLLFEQHLHNNQIMDDQEMQTQKASMLGEIEAMMALTLLESQSPHSGIAPASPY